MPKGDADRFFQSLSSRMAKFGLELAPDKTKILSFSRFRKWEKSRFEFLGFEFRWEVYGKGRDMVVVRRTSPKKSRAAPAALTEWCKASRNLRLKQFFRTLNAKFRSYFNYYGVFGNYGSLKRYYHEALGIVFKWHNRRSRYRSKTWQGFKELLKHFKVPRPCIVECLFESKVA